MHAQTDSAPAPARGPRRRLVWLLWASLGAALLVLVAAAAPALVGYQTLVVKTGSMEPSIPVGSVVVGRVVPPADLRPGEVITFSSAEQPGVLVTHRFVAVDQDETGLRLRTKGDANPSEDIGRADLDRPVARLLYVVPGAGYLIRALDAPWLRLLALATGLLPLVVWGAQGAGSLRPLRRRSPAGRVDRPDPEDRAAGDSLGRSTRVRHWLVRSALVLALVPLLAFDVGILAASGPGLLGYRSVVVASPLAEPSIPAGAVLVQEPVLPAQLQPDDIVSVTTDQYPGTVSTYRVTGTAVEPHSGRVLVRARRLRAGEHQEGADQEWLAPPDQPLGRLIYWVPWAGVLAAHLSPQAGLVLLLLGGVLLMWSRRAVGQPVSRPPMIVH